MEKDLVLHVSALQSSIAERNNKAGGVNIDSKDLSKSDNLNKENQSK